MKTNEADLSSDVFSIFIIFTCDKCDKYNQAIEDIGPYGIESKLCVYYLVCVKVGMVHVEFRKVRNLKK